MQLTLRNVHGTGFAGMFPPFSLFVLLYVVGLGPVGSKAKYATVQTPNLGYYYCTVRSSTADIVETAPHKEILVRLVRHPVFCAVWPASLPNEKNRINSPTSQSVSQSVSLFHAVSNTTQQYRYCQLPLSHPQFKLAYMKTTQQTSHGRRVSFEERIKISEVPSIDDYTDAEYEATWRTKADDKINEMELVKTLVIVRNNGGIIPQDIQESKQLTTRGIEAVCSFEIQKGALSSKNLVISSVLKAQEANLGKIEDTSTPNSSITAIEEDIKNASLKYSEGATTVAIIRGAVDATFARRFCTRSD